MKTRSTIYRPFWATLILNSHIKAAPIFVSAAFLFLAWPYAIQAANPGAGLVTATPGSTTSWDGTALGGATDGEADCVEMITCDSFYLFVGGQPADYIGKAVTVDISWVLPAHDYDLVIHKDTVDGPVVATSGAGPPFVEENAGINPSRTGTGFYVVRVIYFAVPGAAADQYHGVATTVLKPAERTASYTEGGGITFSPNVTVKAPNTVRDGEPSSRCDSQGNYYVCGIRGVPAGVDLWYFDLRPGSSNYDPLMRNPAYRGQPDSFTGKDPNSVGNDGGGDVDLAVAFGVGPGTDPTLAFSSLVAANISAGKSLDRGTTFSLNPVGNGAGGAPVDDRQWNEFFGSTNVFLLYRTIAPVIAFVQRSTDGGLNYEPAVAVGPSSQTGYIDVHQTTGTVYCFFNDGRVAVGDPPVNPGDAPSVYVFHQAAYDPLSVDHLFTMGKVADDGTANGTVYVCYSNSQEIFLVHSTDKGVTWSMPVRVSNIPNGASVFPWLETGPTPGSVVITWYGTANQGYNNNDADWKVYFAQSFNATSDTPSFTQVIASDHFIHGSNISEGGLFGSANRNLIDYFQIAIDPQGAAVIGYTDDHNDLDGATYVTRQISGPGISGSPIALPSPIPATTPPSGTDATPPPQPGSGGEQVTDFAQDAATGTNLTRVDSPSPWDILSIKYDTYSEGGKLFLRAVMKVSDLSALPGNATYRMTFAANAPDSVLSATGDYTYGLSDRGDQFFFAVTTTAPETPTFRYGSAVRNSNGSITYTNRGTADGGSIDHAGGTLTVFVDIAKFNSIQLENGRPLLQTGSALVGLRGTTSGGQADQTRGGTLFVVGGGALPTPTPTPSATPTPTPTPSGTPANAQLVNISARSDIQTGSGVGIAGFIIQGDNPKRVILRGRGPSLDGTGVQGELSDPMIELHDNAGGLLFTNDDWREGPQEQEIIDSGLAPSNDSESAIIAVLNPGSYTVIVRGVNGAVGIGLMEVFDLAVHSGSEIKNLSARANAQTGQKVLIDGIILQGATPKQILFRAIGPSLTGQGVANAMQDPVLDVYDGNGVPLAHNDNWKQEPDGVNNPARQASIEATGLQPGNDNEAAILITLGPGSYTAILRGKNDTTGIALAETYKVDN